MSLPSSTQRFFVRFGLFSLPVLILLGILEYQQFILPNNYQAKETYLRQIQDTVEIIALGNSQTYMGVNPWVMPRPAFNLSNTAQTLTYDFELLQAYHKQLPALRYVILGISTPSLYSIGHELPGDFNRIYHYKHYLGIDAEAKPWKARYYSITNTISIKKSVDRMIDYYTGQDDLIEFDSLGWYTDSVQRDLTQNGLDAAASHMKYVKWEHKAYNLKQLDKLISLCKQNGYTLIIYSPPMYHTYQSNLHPTYYQDMVQTLDSVSSAQSIAYLDFTYDRTYQAEDYFDSNHLRESGSLKLSNSLASLIHSP